MSDRPLHREVSRQVERGDPESTQLAYLPADATPGRIARVLVAMANADGGTVVVGVDAGDDTRPAAVEEVGFRNVVARNVADALDERAAPQLEFEAEAIETGDATLLALATASAERPRSYQPTPDEPPSFPVRRGTETDHLSGDAVGSRQPDDHEEVVDDPDGFDDERLERGTPDPQFVEAPEGRISSLCLFANRYYPTDPTRIRLSADYVTADRAEAVLAGLGEVFEAKTSRAAFTINQRNGAWVGTGLRAFVAALRGQAERYATVEESGYSLDRYGTEQAVMTVDIGTPYPNSTALVYAAPFTDEEGYQRLTVNFLIDGRPVDTRPLVEFADLADLRLHTAETVSVDTVTLGDPSSVPVESVTRVRQPHSFVGDPSVVGVFCENPFSARDDHLAETFGVPRGSALSTYSRLYASLADWDEPGSERRYETDRFAVTRWNSFVSGVQPTVHEVGFVANW